MTKSTNKRGPDRTVPRLVFMSTEQARQLRSLSHTSGFSQAQILRRGLALALAEFSKAPKAKRGRKKS